MQRSCAEDRPTRSWLLLHAAPCSSHASRARSLAWLCGFVLFLSCCVPRFCLALCFTPLLHCSLVSARLLSSPHALTQSHTLKRSLHRLRPLSALGPVPDDAWHDRHLSGQHRSSGSRDDGAGGASSVWVGGWVSGWERRVGRRKRTGRGGGAELLCDGRSHRRDSAARRRRGQRYVEDCPRVCSGLVIVSVRCAMTTVFHRWQLFSHIIDPRFGSTCIGDVQSTMTGVRCVWCPVLATRCLVFAV